MANEAAFEVRVESKDPSVIQSVEAALKPAAPQKGAPHRDLLTIFKLITEAATMISALISLWKQMKSLKSPPSVKVEAKSGAKLDLAAVKSESEIRNFVTANTGK